MTDNISVVLGSNKFRGQFTQNWKFCHALTLMSFKPGWLLSSVKPQRSYFEKNICFSIRTVKVQSYLGPSDLKNIWICGLTIILNEELFIEWLQKFHLSDISHKKYFSNLPYVSWWSDLKNVTNCSLISFVSTKIKIMIFRRNIWDSVDT